MELKEIVEIFKNRAQTQNTYYEAIKWCSENIGDINMFDREQLLIYESVIYFLMRDKLGKWNDVDAEIIIKYLAKKFAYSVGINNDIEIKILDKENISSLHCDEKSCIVYSDEVIDNLLSNNGDDFLRGFQSIFHEVVHIMQNNMIQGNDMYENEMQYTKPMYIMTLETILEKVEPEFYNKNYTNLLRENYAEKIALKQAIETIQKYNSSLSEKYSQEEIQARMKCYDENFYEEEMTIFNKNRAAIKNIDTICCNYIKNNPKVLDDFPVLKLAFNIDGSKKDIIQIIEDRNNMLKTNKNTEVVDELYKSIANQKNFMAGGLKGTKGELEDLKKYIKETKAEDKFIYELIKFRLQRNNLESEKIEEYIKKEFYNYKDEKAEFEKINNNQEIMDLIEIKEETFIRKILNKIKLFFRKFFIQRDIG